MTKKTTVSISTPEERKAAAAKTVAQIAAKKAAHDAIKDIQAESKAAKGKAKPAEPVKAPEVKPEVKPAEVKPPVVKKEPAPKTVKEKKPAGEEVAQNMLQKIVGEVMPMRSDLDAFNFAQKLFCVIHFQNGKNAQFFSVEKTSHAREYRFGWIHDASNLHVENVKGASKLLHSDSFDASRGVYFYYSKREMRTGHANFFISK